MRSETIASIVMLAEADPGATPEIVEAIKEACSPSRRRGNPELIGGDEARAILGGISKVTLSNWVKRGKVKPIRVSRRIYKYDKGEIEDLAYGRSQGQAANHKETIR